MFNLFLILIFSRPFISSLAFPDLNQIHSILLIVLLGLWVLQQKPNLYKAKSLAIPFSIFAAAIAISLIFSSDKITGLQELYKYLSAILLFLVCINLAEDEKKIVVRCLVLSGFCISFLALYQFFFGFRHTLERLDPHLKYTQFTMEYLWLKRVFFPFVTPNILAGYLAMITPLALTLKKGKLIALPLLIALFLTRSIGGLLSLLLGLSIYYYLKGINKKVFAGIFTLAVFSGLILIWRSTGIHTHIQPFFSLIMRINYWEDALEIIRGSPLAGVGMGNFNLALSRYAHNSYLQIWAEMGIFGLIGLLWISLDTLKNLFLKIKNSSGKNILWGLAAANVVFLANNLYSFDIFLPEISFIWWVILGLSRE